MTPLTIGLFGIAALLGAANVLVSLFPKKTGVSVAFIPPSSASALASGGDATVKLDAHIQSTNQKISSLFSRVETLEKSIQSLMETGSPAKESTWLETLPIRNRKINSK